MSPLLGPLLEWVPLSVEEKLWTLAIWLTPRQPVPVVVLVLDPTRVVWSSVVESARWVPVLVVVWTLDVSLLMRWFEVRIRLPRTPVAVLRVEVRSPVPRCILVICMDLTCMLCPRNLGVIPVTIRDET